MVYVSPGLNQRGIKQPSDTDNLHFYSYYKFNANNKKCLAEKVKNNSEIIQALFSM